MLVVFASYSSRGEDVIAEIDIEFPVGSSVINPNFSNNKVQIDDFIYRLEKVFSSEGESKPAKVVFRGAASLEGSYELNVKLAAKRRDALENFIRQYVSIPDSVIVRSDRYIPWKWFKKAVSEKGVANADEIIAISDEPESFVEYQPGKEIDARIYKLQQLYDGSVWKELNNTVFPEMRRAGASIEFIIMEPETIPEPEPEPEEVVEEIIIIEIIEQTEEPVETAEEPWKFVPHGFVKTNVGGWALAIANAGIELDMASHWSFDFSAYYSAWNYFRSDLKFRTLLFRPEFRYWFSRDNEGVFLGVHGALAWYNFAFKGEYRYQDHDRRTPAYGGGIGAGYRMPISKNGRWHVEFGASAGVYKLHYDKFLNIHNGRRVGQIHKTYWGLDAILISFSYHFGL